MFSGEMGAYGHTQRHENSQQTQRKEMMRI